VTNTSRQTAHMGSVLRLLVFVIVTPSDQFVPVYERTVKFRTVYAYELVFSAYVAAAAAAHSRAVYHLRAKGREEYVLVILRDLTYKFHHHRRSYGNDFIVHISGFDKSFELIGSKGLFSVCSVIGNYIEIIHTCSELILKDNKFFGLEPFYHVDFYAGFLHSG